MPERSSTSPFERVKPTRGLVAYFLIDAMRYEMGAELAHRLETHAEVSIRPALACCRASPRWDGGAHGRRGAEL